MTTIILFRNYTLDDKGNIYSVKYKRYLTQRISTSGYLQLDLRVNGITKCYMVHRLLAEYFIPNPENKPCINHKDGNKLNNNLSNLEWCTYSENLVHAYENNLRSSVKGKSNDYKYFRKKVAQIDGHVVVANYSSITEAAKAVNGQCTGICRVCNDKRNLYRGYYWRYIE